MTWLELFSDENVTTWEYNIIILMGSRHNLIIQRWTCQSGAAWYLPSYYDIYIYLWINENIIQVISCLLCWYKAWCSQKAIMKTSAFSTLQCPWYMINGQGRITKTCHDLSVFSTCTIDKRTICWSQVNLHLALRGLKIRAERWVMTWSTIYSCEDIIALMLVDFEQ